MISDAEPQVVPTGIQVNSRPRFQTPISRKFTRLRGRFKAFPVQDDEHYLTVLRYVERNPLRANLVQRSQDWEWSSLKPTERSGPPGLLVDGPVAKPDSWTRFVNGVETEAELKSVRHSLERGTPFGDEAWQQATAAQLGLHSSLRPRGRPRLDTGD